MEWWNDVRMLCARYLVASEQMERSGPVAAVVRAAGYVSEEEEEEEEEEGSSVEEEEEAAPDEGAPVGAAGGDGDGDDLYEDAAGGDVHPPSYPEKHDNERDAYHADKKAQVYPNGDGGGSGADVGRRLSKRQLEKTPAEVHHANGKAGPGAGTGTGNEAPGPAPLESRFTEGL